MVIKPKTRVIIALLIMLIFIFFSNWQFLKSLPFPDSFDLEGDRISLLEKHLERLRELLPERGRIGYVSDMPLDLNRVEVVELKKNKEGRTYYKKVVKAKKDYFSFQYSLSPFVLYPNSTERFLIANFSGPDTDYRDYVAGNYTLVENFGNGIMLFEDRGR